MPTNEYFDTGNVQLPGFKRESRSETVMLRPKTYFSRTEALTSNASQGKLLSQTRKCARPRSSWYSQPSISEEKIPVPPIPSAYANVCSPPVPATAEPLRPLSTPSRSNILQSTTIPSDPELVICDKEESPGGTEQTLSKYGADNHKQRGVSQYLEDRCWLNRSSSLLTTPDSRDGFVDQFNSSPYESMQQSPSPTIVQTLRMTSIHHSTPDSTATMTKIPSQHYIQKTPPTPKLCMGNVLSYSNRSVLKIDSAARAHPLYDTTMSVARHKSQENKLYTISIRTGRTRNAFGNSNQGLWLFIGTMRGPTPSNVRKIDDMISNAMLKEGTPDRGLKDVGKILRYEKRETVDWVQNYVRHRWGVEV